MLCCLLNQVRQFLEFWVVSEKSGHCYCVEGQNLNAWLSVILGKNSQTDIYNGYC